MTTPDFSVLIDICKALGVSKIIEYVIGNRVDRGKIDNKAYETLLNASVEIEKKKIENGESQMALPKSISRQLSSDTNKVDPQIIPLALEYPKEPRLDMSIINEISSSIDKKNTREHVNFVSSLLLAYEELSHDQDTAHPDSDSEDNPTVEESKFDEDWIWRWRDHASQASHEYMRMIWAKILAGEIKNPNSFSLRTMSIVSSLSMSDAERLSKIKDFIFAGNTIYKSEVFTDNIRGLDGIKLNDLLWLEELGVLTGSTSNNIGKIFTSDSSEFFATGYSVGNTHFVVFNEDSSKKIEVRACVLTTSGIEILNLLEIEAHEEYSKDISLAFTRCGCSVYKYIGKDRNLPILREDLEHFAGKLWDFTKNKPA